MARSAHVGNITNRRSTAAKPEGSGAILHSDERSPIADAFNGGARLLWKHGTCYSFDFSILISKSREVRDLF